MSRTRTDIKKFTTISVPSMITSERTNETIMTRLQDRDSKRLQHNLEEPSGNSPHSSATGKNFFGPFRFARAAERRERHAEPNQQ